MISTEIGTGTSHINLHRETGLVVSPGDPQALRDAMDLLYNEPEESARLGNNARSRFENHFTGELMAQSYKAVYQDLLGGP